MYLNKTEKTFLYMQHKASFAFKTTYLTEYVDLFFSGNREFYHMIHAGFALPWHLWCKGMLKKNQNKQTEN